MRNLKTSACALLFGTALLTLASSAQASKWLSFDISDQSTMAVAINGHNVITGYYGGSDSIGFVRKPDGTTYDFGANNTTPVGIDAKGVVFGVLLDNALKYHGFYVGSDQVLHQFDVPGAFGTEPTAINARGDTVGTTGVNAFVRWADGTFQTFGGYNVYPSAINNAGMIAGIVNSHGPHVFMQQGTGSMTTFDLPGAIYIEVASINSSNMVAGDFRDSNNVYHGFVRQADGTVTTFDVFAATVPNTGTQVHGMNGAGDLVGTDYDGQYHGFTRTPDGVIRTFDAPGAQGRSTFFMGVGPDGKVVGAYEDSSGALQGARLNAKAAGF